MNEFEPVAELSLDSLYVMIQAPVRCEASLTNLSDAWLRGINREGKPGLPQIELRSLTDGVPSWHMAPQPAGAPADLVDLQPDSEIRVEFGLQEVLAWPGPGRYQLCAVYEWCGGSVRSEPVEVTVRASSPTLAAIFPARGGWTDDSVAAWISPVEPGSNVVELCVGRITVAPRPTVTHSEALAVLARSVAPIPAVPPNRAIVQDSCIAWLDGTALCHGWTGAFELRRHELASQGAVLAAPLLLNPDAVSADALVIADGELRVFELDSGKAQLRAAIGGLPGTLRWAQAACSADGLRMGFLLVEQDGRLHLWLAEWAGGGRSLATRRLMSCDHVFSGAGLLLTRSDVVQGVLLTADRRVVNWEVSRDGTYEARGEVKLHLPDGEALDPIVVRLSEAGDAFAVLRASGNGAWWLMFPDGHVQRKQSFRGELTDVLFRNVTDPVLVWADSGTGFRFTRA